MLRIGKKIAFATEQKYKIFCKTCGCKQKANIIGGGGGKEVVARTLFIYWANETGISHSQLCTAFYPKK